jgi:hypothetical protein
MGYCLSNQLRPCGTTLMGGRQPATRLIFGVIGLVEFEPSELLHQRAGCLNAAFCCVNIIPIFRRLQMLKWVLLAAGVFLFFNGMMARMYHFPNQQVPEYCWQMDYIELHGCSYSPVGPQIVVWGFDPHRRGPNRWVSLLRTNARVELSNRQHPGYTSFEVRRLW